MASRTVPTVYTGWHVPHGETRHIIIVNDDDATDTARRGSWDPTTSADLRRYHGANRRDAGLTRHAARDDREEERQQDSEDGYIPKLISIAVIDMLKPQPIFGPA